MNEQILIVGSAAQDVIVEVDMDRIRRECARKNVDLNEFIQLEKDLRIRKGQRLKTEFDTSEYEVQIDIPKKIPDENDFYHFKPGEKCYLQGDVIKLQATDQKKDEHCISVNCTAIEWGGGGLNMCKFLRNVVPLKDKPSIAYFDIAMSGGSYELLLELENVRRTLNLPENTSLGGLYAAIRQQASEDRAKNDEVTAMVSNVLANYQPSNALEVFLAAHHIRSTLIRPEVLTNRRNWVFRHIKTTKETIDNKIICRGKDNLLDEEEGKMLHPLLTEQYDRVQAICLNSIKDRAVFEAAYELYLDRYDKDKDVICIMAMTAGMQEFTKHIKKIKDGQPNNEQDEGHWPPFILIMNEKEIVSFVENLTGEKIEFWSENDIPNLQEFAQLIDRIWSRFKFDKVPRIYVTLGELGSLGFDGQSNNIVYAAAYSGRSPIHDTTGCGDAYCATITLLEWAKRRGYREIGRPFKKTPQQHSLENAQEMEYFMGVASAVAYCKAVNTSGRIDRNKLRDVLEHKHLACGFEVNIKDLIDKKTENYPNWIDEYTGKLKRPNTARQIGLTEHLEKLLTPSSDVQTDPLTQVSTANKKQARTKK